MVSFIKQRNPDLDPCCASPSQAVLEVALWKAQEPLQGRRCHSRACAEWHTLDAHHFFWSFDPIWSNETPQLGGWKLLQKRGFSGFFKVDARCVSKENWHLRFSCRSWRAGWWVNDPFIQWHGIYFSRCNFPWILWLSWDRQSHLGMFYPRDVPSVKYDLRRSFCMGKKQQQQNLGHPQSEILDTWKVGENYCTVKKDACLAQEHVCSSWYAKQFTRLPGLVQTAAELVQLQTTSWILAGTGMRQRRKTCTIASVT